MSGAEKIIGVFVAGIITLAIVSTLVKKGSTTPSVLSSLGGATSGTILAAEGQQVKG